jgi:hypothetical protein
MSYKVCKVIDGRLHVAQRSRGRYMLRMARRGEALQDPRGWRRAAKRLSETAQPVAVVSPPPRTPPVPPPNPFLGSGPPEAQQAARRSSAEIVGKRRHSFREQPRAVPKMRRSGFLRATRLGVCYSREHG